MRIGSLFSGAGGLDMAVEEVFGGEVIWQAEVDKAASKVLAYRFPCAPNLGDITQIDWKTVEPLDILCGGFPCQDVSAAGKRAGIKDGTRSGLWSVFADAIDQLRPPLVVIENVRGLLSAQAHRNVEPDEATVGDRSDGPVLRALGAVLGDLSDLGYDAQWTTVAASSVGAPHRRERVFIVATDTTEARWRPGWRHEKSGGNRLGTASVELGRPAAYASDSSRDGWDEGRPESTRIVGGSDAAVSGDEPGVGDDVVVVASDGDGVAVDVSGGKEGHHTVVAPELASTKHGLEVALLPTPTAQCAKHGAESRFGGGNGDVSNLWQIAHLLPTPGTLDSIEKRTTWINADNRALQCQVAASIERHSKAGRTVSGDEVARTLLPTPNASDGTGGGQHPDKREGHSRQLIDYVLLLPTPKAVTSRNATSGRKPDAKFNSGTTLDDVAYINQWGNYAAAIHRWEQIAGPAPAPTEPNRNNKPRLNPAFSEWMMGWPAGWVTDPNIGISRNDQLKIVGNGVCPQQAAAALRYLLTVAEVAA